MRMNFYWGDSPLTWLRYLTVHTFQSFNPSWDVRVWTSTRNSKPAWKSGEAYELPYAGKDWREELNAEWAECDYPDLPPNHVCDLIRWKVLSEGEPFSDFDILYQQPMDEYMHIISKPSLTFDPYFALGLVGGGEPFAAVHERALKLATPKEYQSAGVMVLYDLALDCGCTIAGVGQESTWERLTARIGHLERIPREWVHPHTAEKAHQRQIPTTLGYHWYGGLPESQRLNGLYTGADALDGSPLGVAIRRVLDEI